MHKILRTILLIGVPILFSYILVNTFKPQRVSPSTNQEVSSTLFKGITLNNAGVFLYTNDYKNRYLFAANTTIVNPVSSVELDSFFSTLLQYNKEGICTVIRTTDLPLDSDLYLALKSKNRVSENLFYMACPIFTKGGALAGYLSEVFENNGNGVVIHLQKLKYYTKIVEYNLQSIL